ncbi:MAG: chloride channel protein [Peptococcaceae bacterium]|jgi:CIC family chloride channel protein|nr:chloride channel protein [Peptococcaceae bacterium]
MRTLYRKWLQRFWASGQPQLILLANVVGVLAGFLAILYTDLIRFLRTFFIDYGAKALSFAHGYYIILVPLAGGAVIGILNYFFTRDARSSYGVPGVMEALTMRGGQIRLRTVAARSLAAAVSIGCGGAAGKQGSIVQMGLEVASLVRRFFKVGEQKLRILAMCGVAAMVSANYNTPLAGIIMVFEVIIGEFNPSYLGLVAIPVVVATFIFTSVMGDAAKFPAPQFHPATLVQLPLYLTVGVATGFLGLIYIKVIINSESMFNRFFAGTNYFLRPLAGGLGIGFVVYLVPLAFGRGTQGIDMVFANNLLPSVMLLLILLKLVDIIFTVGAWSTGGGFRAGLFLGTMLGGSMGYGFQKLFPAVVTGASAPSAYALAGMGGLFAAAAQAPFTAIMFATELTNNHMLLIPIAAACATSAYISRAFSDETIFTARLVRQGLDVENARREDILRNILVRHAMLRDVATLPANLTVREAFRRANMGNFTGYPLVDQAGRLSGIVTVKGLRNALRDGLPNNPVTDATPRQLAVITERETLRDAMIRLNEHNIKRLPVVSPEDPHHMVGLLTMGDIMRAYNEDLARAANRNRLLAAARAKREAEDTTGLVPCDPDSPATPDRPAHPG